MAAGYTEFDYIRWRNRVSTLCPKTASGRPLPSAWRAVATWSELVSLRQEPREHGAELVGPMHIHDVRCPEGLVWSLWSEVGELHRMDRTNVFHDIYAFIHSGVAQFDIIQRNRGCRRGVPASADLPDHSIDSVA